MGGGDNLTGANPGNALRDPPSNEAPCICNSVTQDLKMLLMCKCRNIGDNNVEVCIPGLGGAVSVYQGMKR
jgi:hypothetical protein